VPPNFSGYLARNGWQAYLADTMGDPTATQLRLMPLFEKTTTFYKLLARAALFHHTRALPGRVTTSVANIGTNLTQLSDGRTVAHRINRNYSHGFLEQDGVSVCFPVAKAPRSVTLVSPDYGARCRLPCPHLWRMSPSFRTEWKADLD
jgi:hypothetical protein